MKQFIHTLRCSGLAAWLFLLAHVSCPAQQFQIPGIDSLWNVLTTTTSQSERITLQNEIAWELRDYYPEIGDSLAREALEATRAEFNLKEQANSYKTLAVISNSLSKYDTALTYNVSAYQLYSKLEDSLSLSSIYNNAGLSLTSSGRYELAIRSYLNGLRIADKLRDTVRCMILRINMANAYVGAGNSLEALHHFKQAFLTAQDLGQTNVVPHILSGAANACYRLEHLEDAKKLANKSLALRKEVGDLYGMAIDYNSLGNIANDLEDNEAALIYYKRSMEIDEEFGIPSRMAISYINYGRILIELKKDRAGADYIQKGIHPNGRNWRIKPAGYGLQEPCCCL